MAASFFLRMNLKDIFVRKKSVQMRDAVTHVERDDAGNWWYLSSLRGHSSRWRADYDMANPEDKALAMDACTPLHTVLDKLGTMMSRGKLYITDNDGNERRKYNDLRELLLRPNPLQTFGGFVKQAEMCLRLHGYCPISLVRGTNGATPLAMWILPPDKFHLEGTGKYAFQFDAEEVVKRAYLQWGGRELELEPWEYVVIQDGQMAVSDLWGSDILFPTASDSLSQPVSNWVASMSASHTLLVNGGPKGVLSGGKPDELGNYSIGSKEEDEIRDKFKEKYGLVGKKYPVIVTRYPLQWVPLDFDADKLKLHEEDSRCTAAICNALGLNPNLFNDAKYDNQESAKKSAYQDVVIPDSLKIAEALTQAICRDGAMVKIDFTDVECLQVNKAMEASTLVQAADALERLMASGLITPEEARIEVAKYIDIDPDNPKGDYRRETKGTDDGEQVNVTEEEEEEENGKGNEQV